MAHSVTNRPHQQAPAAPISNFTSKKALIKQPYPRTQIPFAALPTYPLPYNSRSDILFCLRKTPQQASKPNQTQTPKRSFFYVRWKNKKKEGALPTTTKKKKITPKFDLLKTGNNSTTKEHSAEDLQARLQYLDALGFPFPDFAGPIIRHVCGEFA
jgi:hypothetical protein